jgi:hypothetical protein
MCRVSGTITYPVSENKWCGFVGRTIKYLLRYRVYFSGKLSRIAVFNLFSSVEALTLPVAPSEDATHHQLLIAFG